MLTLPSQLKALTVSSDEGSMGQRDKSLSFLSWVTMLCKVLILAVGLGGLSPTAGALDYEEDEDEFIPMIEADLADEGVEFGVETLDSPVEPPARPRARPRRRGVADRDDGDPGQGGRVAPPPPPPPAFQRRPPSGPPPGGRFGSPSRAHTSRSTNIQFKATGEKREYPPRPKSRAAQKKSSAK